MSDQEKQARALIQTIYDEFNRAIRSDKYKGLFQAITSNDNRKQSDPHEKGSPVILYTPLSFQPDLMLIATNPSWFYEKPRGSPEPRYSANLTAKQNLADVKGKIPTVNSYIEHGHKVGKKLMDYFPEPHLRQHLADCVGLNCFWIQTGGKSTLNLSPSEKELWDELWQYCNDGTRRTAKILRPKVLWLFGDKAQECFRDWDHRAYDIELKIETMHPSQRPHNQEKADEENAEAADRVGRFLS